MPRHDVIDNRNIHLVDRILEFLPHSQAAHFAVGYFFLSGYKAIAPHVVHLEKLRLLIGNTTNRETLEQMVEGYHRLESVQHRQRAERMNASERPTIMTETALSARDTLSLMLQTDEEQKAALSLAQGIEDGRIEVRIYTKGRLHAKAYIFDFEPDMPYVGAGIVGSSNLSLSGLAHNTELNASLDGNANHRELKRWFDELWDEAEDFSAALMDEIKKSWVANQVTPYEIYLKTLYNLVRDRLEGARDTRLLWEAEMPPLADFQQVAVEQARRILRMTNGVFIADVVGFGKTYIGTALLKHWNLYENAYAVVVCPRSLVKMWEMFLARYGIWGTVLSTGILSQPGNERLLLDDPKYSNAGIVLIDESHNFRNQDTQRYKALQLFTQNRPCILLTATPRNTSAWDIYYQVKLWHPDDRTALLDPPNPPNLADYFRRVEPRNGGTPASSLRDLLDKILIRRTRRHVLDFYGETDQNGRRFVRVQEQRMYFPDRRLDTVSYSIEETYGAQVYGILQDLMGQLTYARYNLYPFVLPRYRREPRYQRLRNASGTLRGLMRVLMFKRFESSVAAFRITVQRLISIHQLFLQAIEAGFIPAGDQAQTILYDTDRDDQVEFADLEEELRAASQEYELEHFDATSLTEALQSDLQILVRMERLIEPITPKLDDKLVVLREMLLHGRNPYDNLSLPGNLPDGKVLIFTQFAGTAQYLYDNIKDIVGEKRIRKVDSDTSDLFEVIGRFAPQANAYNVSPDAELRVLVTTDVLSEGLNLQDGDHVINYDLHWNPVRLIQRVGRVDRLGSLHDDVYVYNFLPEAGVERQLHLQERLSRRIQEIHDSIGEDAHILSPTETINEEAMYAIYQGDERILEQAETDEVPFSLLEAEEIIRQLEQDNPELFDHIKSLPDGVRSSRQSEETSGTYVFCEAQDRHGDGRYRRLFLVDEQGRIITNEISEILRAIQCDETIRPTAIPAGYNQTVTTVQKQFENEVRERQAELQRTAGRARGREYVLQQLQLLIQHATDQTERQKIIHLSRLFSRVPLSRRCHNELNALRARKTEGIILIEQLLRVARDYGLEDLFESFEHQEEILIPRVICSEALR